MTNLSLQQTTKEKTLLIVDDDEHIRAALTEALSMEGYSVLQASSGKSALKMLEVQTVALILSDIEMGEGDGFYLLKEIRSRNNDTPLVFISGHTEISADSVKKLGAVDLIRKPFDSQKLFQVVSKLTGREDLV